MKFLLRIANSPMRLAISGLILLTSTGWAYSQFEDKSLFDSVWWAVVTAATVGYGDLYPKTTGGRIVAMVLIAAMVLIVVPLIVAHFASKLIVDHNAWTNDEQETVKVQLADIHRALLECKDTTNPDVLAALIREVDGDHTLGAGALAEELVARGVRLNG